MYVIFFVNKSLIKIKKYYDNRDYDSNDVYDIGVGTTKEDELFDYADIPSYLKSAKVYDTKNTKEHFEISL